MQRQVSRKDARRRVTLGGISNVRDVIVLILSILTALQLVEFTPPQIKQAYPKYFLKSVLGDGGKNFSSKMDKDIADPYMSGIVASAKWPRWLLQFVSYVIQFIGHDPVLAAAIRAKSGFKSVFEWFKHVEHVQAYQHEFYAAWKAEGLDAVVCPVTATVAVPHGSVAGILPTGFYSMLYNVVNFPAGTLPITNVRPDDVAAMEHYPNTTLTEKLVRKVTAGSEGLPVGVQCVATPYQEELVLRVMREVEAGLRAASQQ